MDHNAPNLSYLNRREIFTLLAGSLAATPIVGASSAAPLPAPTANPKGKSRLILLGTGGGATPKTNRSAPAQVIVVGGASYVIDCGNGVARQMVLAGLKLASPRGVFITHHHSDQNADYGNLLLLSWAARHRAGSGRHGEN